MALKIKNTITIPSSVEHQIVPQVGVASYSTFSFASGSDCARIQKLWKKEGSKHSGGIATIGGAYCVAMTSTFGKPGEVLQVVLDNKNSTKFWVIICDAKNQNDSNCTKWGHKYGSGGAVDILEWYGDFSGTLSKKIAQLKDTLKDKGFLNKQIKKVLNYGKYESGMELKGGADAVQEFIKEARAHVGAGGHDWVKSKTTIGTDGWCAATLCAVAIATKFAGKILPKHKYVPREFCKTIIDDYGGAYIKAYQMGEKNPKVQVGDIAAFQNFKFDNGKRGKGDKYSARHVGVVSKVNKDGTYKIIHGNWNGKYTECNIKKSKIGWFARPDWDKVGGGGGTGGTGGGTGGTINLQDAIAKLYTSQNYEWVISGQTEEDESPTKKLKKAITEALKKAQEEHKSYVPSSVNVQGDTTSDSKKFTYKKVKYTRVFQDLASSQILVQAPYIEVKMNDVKLGGYNNSADKYPNHLVSLSVEKISNRINNYTITMVHQVRAGEDPNIIDTVLSRTGFRKKVQIIYGDSANGIFYKEEEAYVVDVTHNENVASANITYTIKAVSSVGFVKYSYSSFSAVRARPSSEIIKLLYNSGQISTQLQDAFGGMRNKQQTLSKGLIPTNDSVVSIPGLADASPYDRLIQLVAHMRNPSDPSATYMISFQDGGSTKSSFKITEVKAQKNTDGDTTSLMKNCYTLDVGFPGNTMITSFTINNDVYWPLYYKYAGKVASYSYDIDYSGKILKSKVNPLEVDTKFQSKSVEKMNWWDYVRSYPITATITIKGLMKPIVLMENVYIFSQIYGQTDLATGLYSIIGQTDTIDGNGCSTTLQLLKVG